MHTPNEKYWKYLDDFIALCESKQIVVFMFPAYLGYAGQEQGWIKELVANGLIQRHTDGKYKITSLGKMVLNKRLNRIDVAFLKQIRGTTGN